MFRISCLWKGEETSVSIPFTTESICRYLDHLIAQPLNLAQYRLLEEGKFLSTTPADQRNETNVAIFLLPSTLARSVWRRIFLMETYHYRWEGLQGGGASAILRTHGARPDRITVFGMLRKLSIGYAQTTILWKQRGLSECTKLNVRPHDYNIVLT